jgi:hypothetical protein
MISAHRVAAECEPRLRLELDVECALKVEATSALESDGATGRLDQPPHVSGNGRRFAHSLVSQLDRFLQPRS